MNGKRVFIGMPAGRELVDVAETFRRTHASLQVRWVKPENLHLTLVPPWECRDIEALCHALEDAAPAPAPVEVLFDKVSFGPDQRRPRLIWATGAPPPALSELSWRLQALPGIQEERRRPFLLHLTIARFNSHDLRAMGSKKLREPVQWAGLFDSICLYESVMKPEGAEYIELCRVPHRVSGK
ncbi:MAG: RNA 2',3'-cyclic phosphodiesterase [Chlorobiaceae bacterium]|nr:RNA 2',3'-cyclic phosphodiesterase [Chlorobiaceae bacterium]